MPGKLSLCLICKNEQEVIGKCLESVKDIVSEIIAVDTGSTDGTLDILKKYNAKIIQQEWTDDFSFHRNEGLKYATGDWNLMLDADEEIPEDSKPALRQILAENNKNKVYNVNIKNLIDDNDPVMHCNFRLFPNSPDLRFVNPVHEALTISNKYAQTTGGKFYILHYGYLNIHKLRKKTDERNLRILLKLVEKDPSQSHFYYYIGQQYFLNNQFELAMENYKKALDMLTAKQCVETKIFTPLIYSGLAKCYASVNNMDKLLELSNLEINNPDIYVDLGTYFFGAKKYHDSMRMYEKAISLKYNKNLCSAYDTGSMTWKSYAGLGNVYNALNDPIKAIDNFKLSAMYKPENLQILKAIYTDSFALGDLEEAEKYIRQIIALDPTNANNQIDLANVYLNSNKMNEALEIFFKYCNGEQLLDISNKLASFQKFDACNQINEHLKEKKFIKAAPHRSTKNGAEFTVIIPTLLKSPKEVFEFTLNELQNSDLVKKIVIIDNTEKKEFVNLFKITDKMVIVNKEENLYVNNAWNYGMKLCDTKYYILLNDDVLVGKTIIRDCYNIFENDYKIGVLQVSTGNVPLDNYKDISKKYDLRPNDVTQYYVLEKFAMMGWFICGRTENWIDIPKDLKYFFGDNLIYMNCECKKLNIARVISRCIIHFTSTTVTACDLYKQGLLESEKIIFDKVYPRIFPDFLDKNKK
jgi:glycosyltransferase involved in cell wall biosynthesis